MILIKKLALESDKRALAILAPAELTPSQFKIIKFLFWQEGAYIRQVDIERHFSMTNPTVTGLLKNLEEKGWIRREVNPKDSRSKIIRLSDAALARKEELHAYGDQIEESLIHDLTERERETLEKLLLKLLKQPCASGEFQCSSCLPCVRSYTEGLAVRAPEQIDR